MIFPDKTVKARAGNNDSTDGPNSIDIIKKADEVFIIEFNCSEKKNVYGGNDLEDLLKRIPERMQNSLYAFLVAISHASKPINCALLTHRLERRHPCFCTSGSTRGIGNIFCILGKALT
ncbi:hypothetical protein C7W93_06380 [Glaciimonas sp. PCH181]|nr:hypothetical protein C7W93_06380 [Glaciimonas sp. PCH181]